MEHHKYAVTQSAVTEPQMTSLRQEVISALHQKGYSQLRTLTVHTDPGTVIIEGVLPTYYLRQIALECIKRVSGVSVIVDRIQVTNYSPSLSVSKFSTAVVEHETEQVSSGLAEPDGGKMLPIYART